MPQRLLTVWLGLAAATVVWAQGSDPLVNGEAIVRLVATASIGDFNAEYQTTTLRSIASRNIYLVQLPDGPDPEQWKETADADPDTAWVELNYYGQVPEARGRCFYTTAGDDAQQYLDQPAWGQIGLPTAQSQTTGDGIVIAAVDSGIDATHITLFNAILPGGWNFVEDNANTADVGDGLDNDGDGDIDEMTGHGTHVAGIIRRIAPDAWLLPIKVLDSEGLSDNFTLAAGLFYAIDAAVDVINVSVGSTYNSEAVLDAVLEAQSLGIVVVAAGGNADTHLPEEYPALNPGVIGVTSVNELDVKGWFSNWHESFVINAPGEQIISTFPGDIYAAWDGTSMSAPMISAVAALVLTRHPEWPLDPARVNNVRLALAQSADDVDHLNPGYEGMLGAGRLNAPQALAQVSAFAAPAQYPVGADPQVLAAADFDEDGLADLAVVNEISGTLSVLLHQDRQTFAPATHLAVGADPVDVVAGRFNADEHYDLVVLVQGSGIISTLLGAGDGTFSAPASFPVGPDASALAAGDLNGDGRLDLAVPDDDLNVVKVYLGNGIGGFILGCTHGTGVRPLDVVIARLNSDEHLDIATVNRDSNNVSVLLSNGVGGFAPAVHYSVGVNPRAMAASDLDGDGDVDLATANHDSRDITIAWNNGAGVFNTRTTLDLGDGRRAEGLDIADLDCDGDNDLIATVDDDVLDTISIFLNRGDGTFFAPAPYGLSSGVAGVIAADLDGDLDRDVAAVSFDDVATVLLNLTSAFCGDGLFGDLDGDCAVGLTDLSTLLASFGAVENAVYVDGDLDGDGDVDLIDLSRLLGAYGDVCP